MSMRDACIRAVAAALGRDPTPAEARNIEDKISSAMVREARRNPSAWRSMPPDQRFLEAGRSAVREMVRDAQKKTERVDMQTATHARITAWRAQQVMSGRDKTGVDALQRVLVAKHDLADGGMQSLESRSNAIFDDAMRQMESVVDAVSPGFWARLTSGHALTLEPLRRQFVDALHGVTKEIDPALVAAADKYHELAKSMLESYNAAGGSIGRLESWGAPHSWSSRLIGKVSDWKFASDMIEWIDPQAYVHADGTLYSRNELIEMLRAAQKTLASEGIVQMPEEVMPGGAMKANRGRHQRILHLKRGSAFEALSRYSDMNILESMQMRMRSMARDTALIETFGPNADHEFEQQLRTALVEDGNVTPKGAPEYRGKAAYLRNIYDYLAGNSPPPRSRGIADAFDTLAALQVASKLGSATLTSITDFAPMYQIALLNKLNPLRVALNSTLIWAGKSRRYARRMGLMLETLKGEAERYSMENLTGAKISRKIASAVVRVSGLTHVTEARRLGFSMTMMDSIGHLTRQAAYRDVTRLGQADHRILASKGITQDVWDIWRAAKLDRWGANHTLLTPDAIMAVANVPFAARREAVLRLLSIVRDEQDLAVITPGARERTQMSLNLERGTVHGELMRSFMLFKSFPWTVFQRHMERASAYKGTGPAGMGRFSYLASMFVNMTLLGVGVLWVKDLANFKDPRSFDVTGDDEEQRAIGARNWLHAMMQGGAMGIYGDYLFQETSPWSGNTIAETMTGANVGTLAQIDALTRGNLVQAALGEETHAGAEAVRFARSHTPFMNLWQTRALTDRMIWNELSELVDPGYLAELEAKQEQTSNTTYFWHLDDNPLRGEWPERGPEPAQQ